MTILTRIKNNQVTDNTIEYQKLKDGTLVGSKFNANLTLNSNVTILGNLTVANSFAQLNSINTYINDPVVVFNNNYTGSPTYDIGMLINRNLSSLAPYGAVNAAFVWKEADSAFAGVMTTETGTTAGSINNSGFANLFIGNVFGNTAVLRDTTSSSAYTNGALVVAGGVGIGGKIYTNDTITAGGNIVAASGTASSSATTGALVVVGGAGISGNATIGTDAVILGDAYVQGGDIFTSATTFNLLNATATTVNAFGAATTLNIGNASGITNIAGVVKNTGNLVAASGTASSNATTGALVVTGGTGISGALNVGGITTVLNTTESTTSTDGALIVSGGTGIAKNLNVGGNVVITGNLTVNGTQTIIGTTDLAITDAVINLHTYANLAPLTSNDGKDIGLKFHYYDYQDEHAFLGLSQDLYLEWYDSGREGVGNVFTGNTYGRVKAGEFWAANTTASTDTATGAVRVEGGVGIKGSINGGNAQFKAINGTIIGNTSPANATFTTAVTTGVLTSAGNIVGNSGTASSSTTTGALVLTGSGGAGIGGKVYTGDTITAGGNIVAASGTNSTNTTTGAAVVLGGLGVTANVFLGNAVTINSTKTAGQDFIVKGKNDETLIWARPSATYDAVVVGNSAVQANVVTGAKLQIYSTDSILLPVGTSAQRPSSAGGTDVTGMFRYSTTNNGLEYYGASSWVALTTQFTVITSETFNGDGNQVAFTLAGSSTTAGTIVAINGVLQIPTTAYSVSGTTLTFTEAPAVGDVIDVRRLTTTATVTQIASVNGFMQVSVDNDGVYIGTGTGALATTTYWDTSGAQVASGANVAASTANVVTGVDRFSTSVYRSAVYQVQITSGTDYQVQTVTVLHNGVTATAVTHGVIQTNGNLGIFDANISSGNVYLNFIPSTSNDVLRIKKDYLLI